MRCDYRISEEAAYLEERLCRPTSRSLGCYFVDLTPHVVMTVARAADHEGNHYMDPNTEESPAVVEAAAFKQGIVVAQVALVHNSEAAGFGDWAAERIGPLPRLG